MRIITTRKSNASGTSVIIAKGMGTQKTVQWDQSRSTDANHGIAAGALILAHRDKQHPLTQQNADDLARSAVRSIDAGASTHTASDDGQRHVFDV